MSKCEITKSADDCQQVWALLRDIRHLYPGMEVWYWSKVVPEVVAGVSVLVIARGTDGVAGAALAKGGNEPKIRCLRVAPSHQKGGLGYRLLRQALDEIRCAKPLATVAEESMHEISRLLVNGFQFQLTSVVKGLYRPNKLEYIFNGTPGGS